MHADYIHTVHTHTHEHDATNAVDYAHAAPLYCIRQFSLIVLVYTVARLDTVHVEVGLQRCLVSSVPHVHHTASIHANALRPRSISQSPLLETSTAAGAGH